MTLDLFMSFDTKELFTNRIVKTSKFKCVTFATFTTFELHHQFLFCNSNVHLSPYLFDYPFDNQGDMEL